MDQIAESIQASYLTADDLDAMAATKIQKEIEKWMIRTIYAPIKMGKKKKVRKKCKKAMSRIGEDAESAMKDMVNQLDAAFKGKYSNKVQEVMKEEATQYSNL